jgi:predicted Zn-dependent peptidase
VHKDLNDRKVPQLVLGSGGAKWDDPKNFPWTVGWQPTYRDEALAYAKYIKASHPDAKVGVLYQNDDLGKDYLKALEEGLGGGMSSRLFQEVREKRGLCYSIYTFHAPYTDTGFFGLYTGTDPADAPEMMEVIIDVINESVETLTEAEIARAKAQMKAGLLMALESCSSRAEQLARHVLAYGRPQTVEELVTRIDAVSVESTRDAARALMSRSRPAVVALGSGRGLDTAVAFAEGLTSSKDKVRLH